MPLVPPSGFDPNSLSPFVGLAIRLGVGVRSSTGGRRLMLLGNMITSPIARTVGATTYTTVAGTATLAEPVAVASPEDADALFGQGSELALMCRAVFDQYRRPQLFACPVAEGGSAVKATSTLLFAGTVTAAGVVRVVCAGRRVAEVSVAAGDAAATVATNVAQAINRLSGAPFTATVATATVTLAAKQGGLRGNNLAIRCEYTATGGTVALNGGSAGTLARGRFGAGTATPGSVADDITNALAAIATTENLIAVAHDDATNLGLLKAHINTYVAITERKRQQGVAAVTSLSVANAIARAQGLNGPRLQLVAYRDASSGGTVDPFAPCTGELAAQVAAGRLYGDGAVGGGLGRVRGELSYPAANLNGMLLASTKSQELEAAKLLNTEVEQLLQGGVSPVVPSVRNPGFCEVVRCVTTYSLDASNATTYAIKLTSKVTVADFTAQRIEARINAEFPNKNIAPEPANPAESPGHPDVIYPSMLRSTVLSELRALETERCLTKITELEAALIVEPYASNGELIVSSIPIDVIDPFNAFVGEVLQGG